MTKVSCPECPWEGDNSELDPLGGILELTDAGEPMPFGECPECGEVCHEYEGPRPLANALRETYAVINTSHMTEKDSDLLNQLENTVQELPSGILYTQALHGDYGIRVKFASEDIDTARELESYGFSAPFISLALCVIADQKICGVLFDSEGDKYDHMPSFEW